MKDPKTANRLLYVSFGVYVLLLLALLFGKRGAGTINWVPLHTIRAYLRHDKPLALSNLLGNLLLFFPLGVYLVLLRRKPEVLRPLLLLAGTVLAVEAAQYLLRVGAADIDDVLLNAAGGLPGILLGRSLYRRWGERALARFGGAMLIVEALGVLLGVCLWFGVFGIYLRIF